MRKPFDIFAERLDFKKSRGDWTAIELFLAGIRGWEAGLPTNFSGHSGSDPQS
jgi:hypothetical protein